MSATSANRKVQARTLALQSLARP